MKHFTKKLALFTLLAGLCGSAWAQTTLYERGTTNAWSASDVGENAWSAGTIGTNGLEVTNGVASSITIAPASDKSTLTWTATWNPGNATGTANNTNAYLTFGDVTFAFYGSSWRTDVKIGSTITALSGVGTTRSRDYTISVTINQNTKEVSYSFTDNGNVVTGTGTTNSAGSFTTLTHGLGGKSPNWVNTATLKQVQITEKANTAQTANYTIKFMYGNTEVKEAVTRSGEVGATVTLQDIDKEVCYNSDQTIKYIYSSDDASSKTIASDGSTVITVSFTSATKYTYTVKAVDSNNSELGTLATTTVWSDETAKLFWSKYFKVGEQWYISKENSFFTTATGAGEKTVEYEKSDIAYFIECENMNGVRSDRIVVEESESYSGFRKVRINKYYPTIYTDVFEEGGVYNLVLPYHNSNSSNSTYQIRTRDADGTLTDVAEWTCEGGNKTYTLNNIEIPAGSSLAISCDDIPGNSNARMDYLTLTKIATVPGTLAAGKYATRIFPFVPTVPSGVKFYSCAALNGNSLTLTEVSAPESNKPYILENTTGADIDITQAGVDTHEADSYDDGLLTGVFANTEITSGYVLQTQNEKQSFFKVAEDNKITVPPYRAYLNYSAGVKSIGFDTTTAINTLEVLTSGAYEGIYTVEGMKLNRMEKGVNILKMADGTTRKVVVK